MVKKISAKTRRESSFISLLTIAMSQIKQGQNLYQALGESGQYCDHETAESLNILLSSLEQDQTLQPFLEFASPYHQPLITQVCILLYQYSRSGNHEQIIARFLPLLDQLKQINLEQRIKQEEQQMNGYLLIPIVSVIVLTMYFAIGLLSLLVVSTGG